MSANSTYADDVAFLRKHTKVVELLGPGDAKVAVAPAYQGRVMTSTLSGGKGGSFGWVNRPFIESPPEKVSFYNYGGEDRFWLGPEAGQFGLFFSAGEPFEPQNAHTPLGLDKGGFHVTSQGKKSLAMSSQFSVTNYSGTTFHCAVRRAIRALTHDQVVEQLGAAVPAGVAMVGFESSNTLANVGDCPWTKDGGLLSVWILGMLKGLPRGKVIVPFIPGDAKTLGPAATTDYFGKIPAERCAVKDDYVTFSCDGRHRSKIGVSPARSRNVMGSFDPDSGALTVVQFNLPAGAAKLPYVNSLWELQKQPFAGDAINSYNDSGRKGEAGHQGTFYELESSSPAVELAPNQSFTHVHRTYHFAGGDKDLGDLALRILGVNLSGICD